MKGESRLSSSINDESGKSLVDTTLSTLKMLLLGFIIFLFVRKGKIPEIHSIFELFYFLFFYLLFLFLISNELFTYMYFFYNKINKFMKVYSLPCLKKNY